MLNFFIIIIYESYLIHLMYTAVNAGGGDLVAVSSEKTMFIFSCIDKYRFFAIIDVERV
jgi:hypothetical protein